MRKLITTSLMALLAVLVLASNAAADLIPIGQIQWLITDQPEDGYGQFSIISQTGGNSQAPDFPVLTEVLFNADMNLEVTFVGGPLDFGQGDMTEIDGGLQWDSASYLRPLMAVLTGTITPLVLQLDGGSLWNVLGGGALFTIPGALGDGNNVIEDGETAIIYVEAQRAVPEPLSLTLFATGLAGVLARRRMAAKR